MALRDYDATGQMLGNDPKKNVDKDPFGFTGGLDAGNGKWKLGARFYDSSKSAFMQQDRYLGDASDPLSLNRYSYCGLDPVNFIDPTGFAPCKFDVGETGTSSVDNVPKAPPGVSSDNNVVKAIRKTWTDPNIVWFRNQVKNKGPWDYKQLGSEYADFGNFNYGLTGAAYGFPEAVLLRMAGWAQIQAGTSENIKNPGNPGYIFGGGQAPYGDDRRDQAMIKQGIEYYKKWGDYYWLLLKVK